MSGSTLPSPTEFDLGNLLTYFRYFVDIKIFFKDILSTKFNSEKLKIYLNATFDTEIFLKTLVINLTPSNLKMIFNTKSGSGNSLNLISFFISNNNQKG